MLAVLIRQIIAFGPFMAVEKENNVILNYSETTTLELRTGEASKLMCQKMPSKKMDPLERATSLRTSTTHPLWGVTEVYKDHQSRDVGGSWSYFSFPLQFICTLPPSSPTQTQSLTPHPPGLAIFLFFFQFSLL